MDLESSDSGPFSSPESPQECFRNYIIDMPADVSLECVANLNLLRLRSLRVPAKRKLFPNNPLQTLAPCRTRRIGQPRLGALARLGPFGFLPGVWRGLHRQ